MSKIHPQAESFLLTGSDSVACLFIHGFTASPSEIYPVARKIHQITGCTVSGPLLPGHGISPEAMDQIGWEDWWDRVAQEISYLQRSHVQVYVAGLSMGGLLALYAGSLENSLEGIIAINTPIFTNSPVLLTLAPLIRLVRPYHPKKDDPLTRELESQGRFAYPVMPIKALISMQRLRKMVVQQLPNLELPVLIFQSQGDDKVHPRSAQYIRDKAQGSQVRIIELYNSGHIATMSHDQQLIAQEIAAFMEANIKLD